MEEDKLEELYWRVLWSSGVVWNSIVITSS